jgi:nitrile hydratase accessory protein
VNAPQFTPLPGQPHDAAGPVFATAWQAQAFAMALLLNAEGVFTWKEWAAALADEIKQAQAAGDPDDGSTYYHHWLRALERLLVAKGVASAEALKATARAWQEAARATPHGEPIVLAARGGEA